MRIIVAGPPKTGNIWIKCLLSEIYRLEILYGPPRNDEEFKEAVGKGWFSENSIFHQHFSPTPLFLETTEAIGSPLVTIIRNPYDTFISLYHFVQNFPKQFDRPRNPLHKIFGKPIEHPDVVEFLRAAGGGYGTHILAAKKWVESGKTTVVRYENLKTDTIGILKQVSDAIQPIDTKTLQAAVDSCGAQNMRKMFKRYRKHIRKGKVGDWRNFLGPQHLEAIKTHAAWIEALGYEVFEPQSAG